MLSLFLSTRTQGSAPPVVDSIMFREVCPGLIRGDVITTINGTDVLSLKGLDDLLSVCC